MTAKETEPQFAGGRLPPDARSAAFEAPRCRSCVRRQQGQVDRESVCVRLILRAHARVWGDHNGKLVIGGDILAILWHSLTGKHEAASPSK